MINTIVKLVAVKLEWLYDSIYKFHSKHLLIIQLDYIIL